jgi:hypothetical protein
MYCRELAGLILSNIVIILTKAEHTIPVGLGVNPVPDQPGQFVKATVEGVSVSNAFDGK